MIEIADLARIPMFRDLTPDELERIKHLVFERTFRPGAMLFIEGMQGEVFYLVKRGKVEIRKKRAGVEMVIATLGVGDFVGEMAVLDEEPRSATARVVEETTMLIITRKSFQDILKALPEGAVKILMIILKNVNQRLREANRKLTAD